MILKTRVIVQNERVQDISFLRRLLEILLISSDRVGSVDTHVQTKAEIAFLISVVIDLSHGCQVHAEIRVRLIDLVIKVLDQSVLHLHH